PFFRCSYCWWITSAPTISSTFATTSHSLFHLPSLFHLLSLFHYLLLSLYQLLHSHHGHLHFLFRPYYQLYYRTLQPSPLYEIALCKSQVYWAFVSKSCWGSNT